MISSLRAQKWRADGSSASHAARMSEEHSDLQACPKTFFA